MVCVAVGLIVRNLHDEDLTLVHYLNRRLLYGFIGRDLISRLPKNLALPVPLS